MSRDRGIHADIWERAERRYGSGSRSDPGTAKLLEALSKAVRKRDSEFLRSVYEQVNGGQIPTGKQLAAVNTAFERRGMPRVSAPIREPGGMPMKAVLGIQQRREAIAAIDKMREQRPLKPPGRRDAE